MSEQRSTRDRHPILTGRRTIVGALLASLCVAVALLLLSRPEPAVGLPVRLRIPAIAVDAAVEHVGLTPDGAMDVPASYADVAWYTLGPKPGEPGNAAIAGHLDSPTARTAFWDLRKRCHHRRRQ
jgi:hypothetical protein